MQATDTTVATVRRSYYRTGINVKEKQSKLKYDHTSAGEKNMAHVNVNIRLHVMACGDGDIFGLFSFHVIARRYYYSSNLEAAMS
jgi:hypothetical protein